MFENGCCYDCGCKFDHLHYKPTLDRQDISLGHSLDNCKPCCEYCNTYIANHDKNEQILWLQIRKYADFKGLPFTLDVANKDLYTRLREGITGGLSNVLHRANIKGETHINKFRVESGKVIDYDTENIMTHAVGFDFNSLYPSVFSGAYHQANPWTGHRIWQAGAFVRTVTDKTEYMRIIKDTSRFAPEPQYVFTANITGHIPEHRLNDVINFPPIIRNVDIVTNRETIGDFMYNYMTKNGMKVEQKERKLTNLVKVNKSTMFSCYELWLFIDRFDFVIDEIECVDIFRAHISYESFVKDSMNERIDATLAKNEGVALARKMEMNGSFGYDIMNTENYNKVYLFSANQTLTAHQSENYVSERKLCDDLYQVNLESDKFRCDTRLQAGFWTLSVAKVWYVLFIYDFIYKCVDTDKIHFIEGDTDSMYWAVSGNPEMDYKQGFEYCLKNKEFYNKFKYLWLPNEEIKDKKERTLHEKKILGCCIEKVGDNMIALCPKCYTIFNNKQCIALKSKGVNLKQNKQITYKDYLDIVNNGNLVMGTNTNLQVKGSEMCKPKIVKTALSGAHTKMRVQVNGACHPFL